MSTHIGKLSASFHKGYTKSSAVREEIKVEVGTFYNGVESCKSVQISLPYNYNLDYFFLNEKEAKKLIKLLKKSFPKQKQ